LNAQVLSSFQLIIPPKPIASAFRKIVNALRNKVVAAVNESRTLAALRDALLPKLISGEIQVKDAERFLEERGL
jgi:type I restriction enzyme S subunit